MARADTDLNIEYILTHDCSANSINYNILHLSRWHDDFGNAGTTDKVIGLA